MILPQIILSLIILSFNYFVFFKIIPIHQNMPIPLYIITGFLGSGKTTLLKRILHQYADDKKIAVMQNEFAPLNVDAVELERTGKTFQILEINRGSVFCVCLLADFKSGLADFVDAVQPDAVFLEASGLADPIAVVEILEAPHVQARIFLARIWNIVDVSTFLTMSKVNLRLEHQVRVADIVIKNKMDKAEAETSAAVTRKVKEINPFANIIPASYCDVELNLFRENASAFVTHRAGLADYEPHARPNIGTAVLKSTRKITLKALEQFLREQEVRAYRLKGHVQLADGTAVMVQSSFGDTLLVPLPDYCGPSELVSIGPDVRPKEFSKRFRDLAEK